MIKNIIIGLAILLLLLILLYNLYLVYYSNKTIITKQITLNEKNTPILNSTIVNPSSTNFSYGFWVYVNTWSNNGKTLMFLDENGVGLTSAIDTDITTSSDKKYPDFSIGLSKNTPTLYCTIGGVEKTVITDKFPIQKWTYIVVSLDGNILDSYLDGKLVVSKQVNFTGFIDTIKKMSKDNIYLGDCNPSNTNDIFITKFNRWDTALDPKTVWNNYLNGNGVSSSSTNYNINLEVSHNNNPFKNIRLF